MRISPESRCKAFDWGRQCQRKRRGHLDWCERHYARSLRNGGETRSAKEIGAIKAREKYAKLRALREACFGPTEGDE